MSHYYRIGYNNEYPYFLYDSVSGVNLTQREGYSLQAFIGQLITLLEETYIFLNKKYVISCSILTTQQRVLFQAGNSCSNFTLLSILNCTVQTKQTAYPLSQGGLRRPKLTRHDMLRFYDRFFQSAISRPLVKYNTLSGVKFYNFKRSTPILNMKHNIFEFSLFVLKILCFVSKGSLNIP